MDSSSSSAKLATNTVDESEFTLVSYSKKARASMVHTKQSADTNASEKSSIKSTPSVVMQMVTTWQFKSFQQLIVPVIEKLIDSETHTNHPFTRRWLSTKITATSTLRTVMKELNLKTIQDYRRFLMTAPDIDKYVVFGNANDTGTGFQYYIKP